MFGTLLTRSCGQPENSVGEGSGAWDEQGRRGKEKEEVGVDPAGGGKHSQGVSSEPAPPLQRPGGRDAARSRSAAPGNAGIDVFTNGDTRVTHSGGDS